MTGFKVVSLLNLIEEIGEDDAKAILSDFSCPLNPDVETFLREKAIPFSKQGWAQTQLIFASYIKEWRLVAYFTLANKSIVINGNIFRTNSGHPISKTLKKRIKRFAHYEKDAKSYIMSAPLIGQLGKNYTDGLNNLISGDEVLLEACNKVKMIQSSLGGRFVYVECEDIPALIDFYTSNGFCAFCNRPLDPDETNLKGDYLVQLIKYLHYD